MLSSTAAVVLVGRKFDIFVDSVNGSDSNSGLTQAAPKLTIAAAQALLSSTRKRIGLARNSQWREQLSVSVDGSTVGSYGSGSLPILDASDTISAVSWSKTAGLVNVYQASVTFAVGGNASTWANIFETGGAGDSTTGQFLSQQTSSANVDAVAGSYFISGMTAGAGIPAGSVTLFVRATDSTNPGSNGYTYEFTSRLAGLLVTGNGATISNIECRKNAGILGAMQLNGFGPYKVDGCILRDGCKHVMLAPSASVISNCRFINSYYANNFGGLLVIFEATGTGSGATIFNNIFQQDQRVDSANTVTSILSHTNSGSIGTISVQNNWFIGKNSSYIDAMLTSNTTLSAVGNYASQTRAFCTVDGTTTLSNNQVVTDFSNNQIITFSSGQSLTMTGNLFAWSNGQNDAVYCAQNSCTIVDTGNTWYAKSPQPNNNGVYENFSNTTGNTLTVNGSVFDTALSSLQPLQLYNTAWTYTGGNVTANTFVASHSVSSWVLNGTTYASLAIWQAGGFDTNAITTGDGSAAATLPTIPSIS